MSSRSNPVPSAGMVRLRLAWMCLALLPGGVAQDAAAQATAGEVRAATTVASVDDSLHVDGEEVDARIYERRLTIPVRVNGAGPFAFVVDSGADRSVIGQDLAARLRLPAGRPVRMVSIVETSSVTTRKVDMFRLGNSEIADLEMPALEERHIGAHGLIGLDALAGQRLVLDFDRKKIVIEDARRKLIAQPGEIVVTARRLDGLMIITNVSAAGQGVMAAIDSGSVLTVGNAALFELLAKRGQGRLLSRVIIVGVTGARREIPFFTIPDLEVGPVRLRNVQVALSEMPTSGAAIADDKPALLLGTDILQAFSRVSLDFRHRKVRFQLRPSPAGVIARGR